MIQSRQNWGILPPKIVQEMAFPAKNAQKRVITFVAISFAKISAAFLILESTFDLKEDL